MTPNPCTCDLRDRRWNPATGRCERCGARFTSEAERRRVEAIDAEIARKFPAELTPVLPFEAKERAAT